MLAVLCRQPSCSLNHTTSQNSPENARNMTNGRERLKLVWERKACRRQFWTPQRLADGSVNEQNYALGWRWREWNIEGVGVVRNANHGGVSRGSQCWLLLYPDYTMSMAFCTNAKTEEFGTFGQFYESLFLSFVTIRLASLTSLQRTAVTSVAPVPGRSQS